MVPQSVVYLAALTDWTKAVLLEAQTAANLAAEWVESRVVCSALLKGEGWAAPMDLPTVVNSAVVLALRSATWTA